MLVKEAEAGVGAVGFPLSHGVSFGTVAEELDDRRCRRLTRDCRADEYSLSASDISRSDHVVSVISSLHEDARARDRPDFRVAEAGLVCRAGVALRQRANRP